MVKLAWRNLWRNPRRTGLTLFLISFSVLLLASFQVLSDGKLKLLGKGLELKGTGHLRVRAPQLDTAAVNEALEPLGVRWSFRRQTKALVSSARGSRPAELWAIDPVREGSILPFLKGIALKPDDTLGVVLSAGLARALGVRPGDGVVLTLSGDGFFRASRFRVRQVIEDPPGAAPSSAFITLKALKTLGEPGPDLAPIVLSNFWDFPRYAEEIARRLPPGHRVETIREFDPAMWVILKLQDYLTAIVVVLVYSLAAVGILNTLVVSVVERTREFGLLKALGMSQARLVATYYWEVLFLLAIGLAAGLLLSAPSLWFLCTYGIPIRGMEEMARTFNFPVEQTSFTGYFIPSKLFRLSLLVSAITLFAGLLPLSRLRKISPARAMRD